VNGTKVQTTLREWRAHMVRPVAASLLIGVVLILTLIAPFGMDRMLAPLQQLGYWAVIVLSTYSVGFLVDRRVQAWVPARHADVSRLLVGGVGTGVGVAALVVVINAALLSFVPRGMDLAVFVATTFSIALIIAVMIRLVMGHDAAPSAGIPLLARIPLEKRGALIALSVEDHYVHIRTTRGEAVVLMRLSDAMGEVGGCGKVGRGLQVHRSHWVALDRVVACTRKGDGAVLRMTAGGDIPVSRANMAKIKEAGLLPRG